METIGENMEDRDFLTLGIETSCDETAIAVIKNGREVLSNVISSQIEIFKNYGGVVPEIASRHHLENINGVLEEALNDANITLDDIDLIAVTEGPGLVGALLMGVATAKAIGFSHSIPVIGVHHILGHISANYLNHPELEPPFISLVASGGHTELLYVSDYCHAEVMGETRDDAVGEAYDKVARVLGLGYPGGPKIDKIAGENTKELIPFKRVYLEKGSYDFSFSGLKTQVLNYINSEKQANREIDRACISDSFQRAVCEVMVKKTMDLLEEKKEDKLILAGGVASNSCLREMLKEECKNKNIRLYIPEPVFCTDNGAMIGCQGYFKYKQGGEVNEYLDANPSLEM